MKRFLHLVDDAGHDESPVDPDLSLVTAYVSRELSLVELIAVEERLRTDAAFRERVQFVLDSVALPVSFAGEFGVAAPAATHVPDVRQRASAPRKRSLRRIAAIVVVTALPVLMLAQVGVFIARRSAAPDSATARVIATPLSSLNVPLRDPQLNDAPVGRQLQTPAGQTQQPLPAAALASDQAAAQRSETTVVRVGAPLHAGMGTLAEEVTLGKGGAAVEYQFTMPYVFSGPSGGVFVVDVSNPMGPGQFNFTVRLYDSTGKFVRAFGRTGQGPGEYSQMISDVKHLPDGRVLVAARRGVLVYTATGTYLEQLAPTISIKLAIRNGKWMDSPTPPEPTLPPPPLVAGGPLQFGARHFAKWSSLGYFVTTYTANYAVDLRVPRASGGASTSTAPWAEGDPVVSIRRSVAPIPVSAAERADWHQSLTMFWRRQRSNWAWDGPEIPLVKPAISALQVAPDGRIWVRVSQPSILNPAVAIRDSVSREAWTDVEATRRWVEPWVYDVLEPTGQYLGQVRFPDTRTPAFSYRFDSAMHGETVWGVVYDQDDVPSVKRYRIRW